MKRYVITLVAGLAGLAAGCTKDNITPPTSQLSGRITFQDQAVGVRGQGAVQLELWQRGEFFFNKLQVFVAQDGTYNATLFDGEYKLTRLRDNGPWQNNTDSITVQVRGNTVVDVPVQPYFTLSNTSITRAGNSISASSQVTKTSTQRDIESVTLFLNYTQFVDANNSLAGQTALSGTAVANLSQPLRFSFTLPTAAQGRPVYGRVGVRTRGVGELFYSPVQLLNP